MHHPLGHRQGPWPHLNRQQQLALRIDGRPHPVAGALQAFDRFVVADLAIVDAAQHGIELVKLQLAYVHVTEKIARKGLELLGGVYQSVQDRVGVDLEHPGRGTHAQALGQTGQYTDDQLHRHPFAMKDGAMMLRKVAVAGDAVALTPLDHRSDARWHGDSPALPSLDSHRWHGGRNAWRYRPHAAAGWSWASDQVTSVAVAWDVRPRVHTAHKGACRSGPQTVEVLWNGCAGV